MEFKLPNLGEGIDSGECVAVHVKPGDRVEKGQTLVEVETNKAVMEVPSPVDGSIETVAVEAGQTLTPGQLLVVIGEAGGAVSESAAENAGGSRTAPAENEKEPEKPSSNPLPQSSSTDPGSETLGFEPSSEAVDVSNTHLVVIGAGPGGYAAAFYAADLGFKVTLVNKEDRRGGVCLLRGCIPSKGLLHVAKLINETKHSAAWGVEYREPKIDIDQLRSWKDGFVNQLSGGIDQLAKARKVEVVQAEASFKNANTLNLKKPDGSAAELAFDKCIIATGSIPAMPGPWQIGDDRVMDSTGALALADIPEKLLVIGGGYIGLEMSCVYAALGSEVTVVEFLPDLLMAADRDLVRPLKAKLKDQFKNILTNTKVEGMKAAKKGIEVIMSSKDGEIKEVYDRVLVSVGRRPVSQDLGLENTAIQTDDKGFIIHDNQQRTAENNIFVIGDIAGEPMLAHKASAEARVAVEVAAGQKTVYDRVAMPAVVFTDPELAWVGLTEVEAKEKGINFEVARFPWAASGRALTLDRTEGMTKLIFEKETERVIGVGIVGAGAGDLIAEGALAIEMAAVVHDIAGTIHPHPTLGETVMEAAEAFLGTATHMYRPKKK